MRTLIHQHTTPLTRPCRTPFAFIVITLGSKPVCNDIIRALNISQFARSNQFSQFLMVWTGSLIEHQGKYFATFFGSLVHLINLSGIYACGFLDQYMQIVLKSLYSKCRMIVMRRRHNNRIDSPRCDQIIAIVKCPHVFPEVVARPLNPIRIDIAYRCQLPMRNIARRKILRVTAPSSTNANNTYSHLFHIVNSSFANLVIIAPRTAGQVAPSMQLLSLQSQQKNLRDNMRTPKAPYKLHLLHSDSNPTRPNTGAAYSDPG